MLLLHFNPDLKKKIPLINCATGSGSATQERSELKFQNKYRAINC